VVFGSRSSARFPRQRWQIAPAQPVQAQQIAQAERLHPLIAQVLLNRGIETAEAAQIFLNPELQQLPSPMAAFEDLPIALELLLRAIADRQYIAICGDYDADGMTSTALLLRALRFLGAVVDYAIPSRMQEGYGINRRIIEEFHEEGVALILTVDNGIAAHEPIALARELGLAVIVTDHHDIPPTLPNANAILNPKLIPEDSPYRGVAGVGVAYILAVCLAQALQKTQDLTTPLIELFTLGTIADLAPLTGVNRRWVKRGLKLLPRSRIPGIQALIQVAGLSQEKALKPEAIGFRLGPRINAIGRLSDPQIVIELLTTDDDGVALEQAMKCEQVNQLRQRLCELIEQEAIAWCTETQFNPQQSRVLVIVQAGWHHGVIGIVASRLVERYGVPVFIGTYEGSEVNAHQATADASESEASESEASESEANTATVWMTDAGTEIASLTESNQEAAPIKIRGSARSIPEFDIFEALQHCGDLLEKFGGHRAAGGFTLAAENLTAFRQRLEAFAAQALKPEHLKPLVAIDAEASFEEITFDLYEQLDVLHPCGIENPDPVFWTPAVQVVEQRQIGRDRNHLKVTLATQTGTPLQALAWRWGEYFPLPERVDIAYRLRLNDWNGNQTLELELIGVRPLLNAPMSPADDWVAEPFPVMPPLPPSVLPSGVADSFLASEMQSDPNVSCFDLPSPNWDFGKPGTIEFYYSKRKYCGNVLKNGTLKELRINNTEGQVLVIHPEQRRGFLEHQNEMQEIDVTQSHYFNLVRSALMALELAEKTQMIQTQRQLLSTKQQEIEQLKHQMELLQDQIAAVNSFPAALQTSPETWIAMPLMPVSLEPTVEPTETALESMAIIPEHLIDEAVSAVLEPLIEPKIVLEAEETDPTELGDAELQPGEAIILPASDPAALVKPNLPANEAVAQTNPTPAEPVALPSDPKQRLIVELGTTVWQRLDSRSQKDLIAAYKKQAEASTEPSNYSDAGLRLCSVIEREVVQPFFKELHQFLLEHNEPCEIGGITLRARKKYTLGMLPPLLAAEWQSFQDEMLTQETVKDATLLYTTVVTSLEPDDQGTIQVFLAQWEHTLAFWLQSPSAASLLAQVDKLLTLAADAENPLYEWQFQHLHQLIIGTYLSRGILEQIYSQG
jgi:single-stranded-DNA-specific exonuclease